MKKNGGCYEGTARWPVKFSDGNAITTVPKIGAGQVMRLKFQNKQEERMNNPTTLPDQS